MQAPIDRELKPRLDWLVAIRWYFIAALLLLCLAAPYFAGLQVGLAGFFLLAAVMAAYNSVFAYTALASDNPGLRLNLNIFCDWLALSALIYLTGGIESPLAALYFLHLIVAGMLLPPRQVYIQAGIACALYSLTVLSTYSGLLPQQHITPELSPDLYLEGRYVFSFLGTFTAGIFLAAWLSSTISGHIREEEKRADGLASILRGKNQELEQLYREQRDLADKRDFQFKKVSHELKGPLSTLITSLRTLSGGHAGELNKEQKALLDSAEERGSQLHQTLSDLLVLSRAEQSFLAIESADASKIAHEALAAYRPQIESKGLKIESFIVPLRVRMEPQDLYDILDNLLSNAVKYTERGKISVSLGQHFQSMLIEVSDTGIGVSPKERAKLFDQFYRTRAAKERDKTGSGLGLTIVKTLTERYEGTVRVESEGGKGTKIRIKIPLS